MRHFVGGWFLIGLLTMGVALPAHAAIPQTLAFQGKLTDSQGQPLDGNQGVMFRLYNAAAGGTKLWEETQTVAVSNGLFSAQLGSVTALNLVFDQPYWVEVVVGGEVLAPRQPLAASPYALRSQGTDGISISNDNVSIGVGSPAKMVLFQNGNVTVGASTDQNTKFAVIAPSGTPFTLVGNGTTCNYVRTTGTGGDGSQLGGFQFVIANSAKSQVLCNQIGANEASSGGEINFTTKPNGGAIATRMTITSSGNIGIGTKIPQAELEVNGAARLAPTGRPGTAAPGTIYYDATARHFYGFDGTAWKQLDN